MIKNVIEKTESLLGHVGARIPKDIEDAIKEKADKEDRPIAYIVRKTLIKEFRKKK